MHKKNFLVDVMTPGQKKTYRRLVLGWVTTLVLFWTYWLQPSHFNNLFGMVVNSILLAWTTLLPGYYFYFVSRMKKPNPRIDFPENQRVAMVVTKVPSEPFSLVKETLEAMLAQEYPHDTWLADEDPTEETIMWCKTNNVFISSRKGIDAYHRPSWPRRTRSKEGNLAYFYDMYGYEKYDIVVQLDADHRPEPDYLMHMLRPFVDPEVGYVSAPSICDNNAATSWAARARLYAESSMHGSLQAGYNGAWAPLCIGSHYAVRTSALQNIGGLGPELAEDHSTTFLMNVHGWKGVHALDAIAHGDGPASFADCMIQEFQWSRSLINILFTLTPKHYSHLPRRLQFQFLFAQLWYPLFGIIMCTAYLLPVLALIFRFPWANVSYLSFLLFSMPVTVATIVLVMWIKNLSVMRPHDTKIICWEVVIFQLTRWPWIVRGIIAATFDSISGKHFEFKVTPKGASQSDVFPINMIIPYMILSIIAAGVAIFQKDPGSAQGYYYFLIIGSSLYTISILTIIFRNMYEKKLHVSS